MNPQSPEAIRTIDYILGASPFALVVGALLTNYLGYWVWGRDLKALETRFDREKAEWKADRDEWKSLALQHAGIVALATDATRLALPQKGL